MCLLTPPPLRASLMDSALFVAKNSAWFVYAQYILILQEQRDKAIYQLTLDLTTVGRLLEQT